MDDCSDVAWFHIPNELMNSPHKNTTKRQTTKIKLFNVQVRWTITFSMNHSTVSILMLHILKKRLQSLMQNGQAVEVKERKLDVVSQSALGPSLQFLLKADQANLTVTSVWMLPSWLREGRGCPYPHSGRGNQVKEKWEGCADKETVFRKVKLSPLILEAGEQSKVWIRARPRFRWKSTRAPRRYCQEFQPDSGSNR